MVDYIIRTATKDDVPFLVDTVIEAEKAGTKTSPYETLFGLSEIQAKSLIREMFLEELDGCELSISSYLVLEMEGKVVAALSAWVEGAEGMSSAIIKGNLLNFTLPKESVFKAAKLKSITQDLHIEYTNDSIQIGAGYVDPKYRGDGLLGILIDARIKQLSKFYPNVKEVYDHMYSCNLPALKTDLKLGFEIILTKESSHPEVERYLPSNKKHLVIKKL